MKGIEEMNCETNIDDILLTIARNNNGRGYCIRPTVYDGTLIDDKIIEEFKQNEIKPTHLTFKFNEDYSKLIVTIEYCEAFGACARKVIEDKIVEIDIKKRN